MPAPHPSDLLVLKSLGIPEGYGYKWEDLVDEDGDSHRRLHFRGRGTPMATWTILRGRGEIRSAATAFRRLLNSIDDECKFEEHTAAFAMRYGALKGEVPSKVGQAVDGSLDEWRFQIRKFDTLTGFSTILKRGGDYRPQVRKILVGDWGAGERAILDVGGGMGGLLEGGDTSITIENPISLETIAIRPLEILRTAAQRDRIWAAFTAGINLELRAGLSLALPPHIVNGAPAIAPKGILATLYAYLWIDLSTALSNRGEIDLAVRYCAIPDCPNVISAESKASKLTCSGKCRKELQRIRQRSGIHTLA